MRLQKIKQDLLPESLIKQQKQMQRSILNASPGKKPAHRGSSQPVRRQQKSELILNDEKEPISISKVFTKDDKMLKFISNGLLHLEVLDEKGKELVDKSTYTQGFYNKYHTLQVQNIENKKQSQNLLQAERQRQQQSVKTLTYVPVFQLRPKLSLK